RRTIRIYPAIAVAMPEPTTRAAREARAWPTPRSPKAAFLLFLRRARRGCNASACRFSPTARAGEPACSVGEPACGLGEQACDFGEQTCDFGEQTCDFGEQTCDFGEQTCDFGEPAWSAAASPWSRRSPPWHAGTRKRSRTAHAERGGAS